MILKTVIKSLSGKKEIYLELLRKSALHFEAHSIIDVAVTLCGLKMYGTALLRVIAW